MTPLSPISAASSYDQQSFWAARFGALLFQHLELAPNLRILDLATGTGYPLLELAQAFGASSYVVGLDLWWEALERAEAKRLAYDQTNATLVCGNGVAMPFSDESFDLIVIHLGLNNFDKPDAVLAECARVAKHGARLVATSNLKGHYAEFYGLFRPIIESLGNSEYVTRLGANENHRGTVEGWSAALAAAGFTVTKTVEDSFIMRFLDGDTMLKHLLVRIGFLPAWESVVDEAERPRVFAEVKARLNEVARQQGELRMNVPMVYLESRRQGGLVEGPLAPLQL
jgi:arsenite methyltransferase